VQRYLSDALRTDERYDPYVTEEMRTKHVFVVEMWCDGSARSSASWRGMVKHVTHRHQRYFASLGDLTDFITLRLEAPLNDDGDLSA